MSIGSHQPIYAANTQYKIWHNQRNTQNLHQYFTIVKPQFHLHRITSQFLFIFRKSLYLQQARKLVFWFLLFWICKSFPWSRKRCEEIRLDFCFLNRCSSLFKRRLSLVFFWQYGGSSSYFCLNFSWRPRVFL